MEINWKRVFRFTIIEVVIITLAFGGWYYLAVKVPQEERIQRNIERNLRLNQQVIIDREVDNEDEQQQVEDIDN